MAGDWIKIEKDTPDKPEILAIASILNVHPDEAFGKCFRFWRWADSHLVDGNAAGVTESSIDALVGLSGFSRALLNVGWLQTRSGSFVVPRFDRHMSQSAKQRALTANRVASYKKRSANDSVTVNALPREEKRRDKKSKPKEIFRPPTIDEVHTYCLERQNGIDAERFVSFYESKGWKVGKTPMQSWKAAIVTWEKKNLEDSAPRQQTCQVATKEDAKDWNPYGTPQ